jgi:hypothetical protein
MVEVNYVAVLLAALATMLVGSVWYTPAVFGKIWMKLAKVKPDQKMTTMQMTKLFGLTFIAALVSAYVLAHVTYLSNQFFGNTFLQDALSTGFWLWLGFVVARILTHDLFEGRPGKLTLLTAGNEFVTVMVMALIIGLLGV